MEMDDLIRDVSSWIRGWVDRHSDALGSKPCPYAAPALDDGRIDWAIAHDPTDLSAMLDDLPTVGLMSEVLVIGMEPESIDPDILSSIIRRNNVEHLMPNGLVALEDHPKDPEIVNGVAMNNGRWVLVLVQNLSKLNRASEVLRSKGYYDNWSDENLADVLGWRFNQTQDR